MNKICLLLVLLFFTSGHFVNGQRRVEKIDLRNSEKSAIQAFQKSSNGFRLNIAIDELSLNEVVTEKGVFYKISSRKLMKTFKKGYPDLPVVSRLVQIPFGAKVNVKVISYEEEIIRLSDKGIHAKIYPAQPSQSKSDILKEDKKFYYNQSAYEKKEFLNKDIVSFEERGVLRHKRLGRIEIAPVQYNPAGNILRLLNNIEVEVNFEGADNSKTREMEAKYGNYLFKDLSDQVINYQSAQTKELIDQSPVTYVIVSDRMFESQLQPFIEWKKQKGFNVITAYTDEIGGTTSEIKAYLEDLYNNPEPTPPSFVLFVGDVQQIPAWDGQTGWHVTDLYYCEYTGDKLPEVYYGRFSAQNTAQLQPQIDKTLEYEKYEMAEPGYLSEALLVAGDDESMEDVQGNGTMWYADNYYFNSDHGINSHLFLQDPPNGNAAVHDSIIENVNSGIGYANYTAHCSSTGWANPSFSNSDVAALTNAGKYGLWVGNCCESVKFDDNECFGEAALRAENSGAIGDIGGSNSTYWDEDYWWGVGYLEYPVAEPAYEETGQGVYDGMFHTKTNEIDDPSTWHIAQGQIQVCGNLAVEASTSALNEYYWEIYHLMGDPSLMPYLGIPEPLTVSATPSELIIGMSSLTVNTEPNAYVALSVGGDLLDAKVADAYGQADLSFESLIDTADADLVVTAQNRQPYREELIIKPADEPFVAPDSTSFNDDAGNNNGEADYGETLTLDIALKNLADSASGYDALSVNGTLSTTDPYVTINDSLHAFGDLAAGESNMVEEAYSIKLSDEIPDKHRISFNLKIDATSDTAYVWNATINLTVNAPSLEIGEMTITGDDDANGRLDPGETADLTFSLINNGHADATGVIHYLSSDSPYLNVLNNEVSKAVSSGDTTHTTFNVSANSSTAEGEVANITSRVIKNTYADTAYKKLNIGKPKDITTGEDTKQSGKYPFYTYYENNKTQILYHAGEIGLEQRIIDKIGFDFTHYDTYIPSLTNLVIIVKQTTIQELESSYEDMSGADTVLNVSDYSMPQETGWYYFDIEDYTFNSSKDLIVEITWGDNGSYGTPDSYYKLNSTATSFTSVVYGYSDTQTPPSYDDNTAVRPNAQFTFADTSTSTEYEATFSVTDGTDPITTATVTVGSFARETDADGEVIFNLSSGTYDYTVTADAFEEVTGSLTLSSGVTEDVTMTSRTSDVTFNLFEKDETTSADGAITFNGSTQNTSGGTYTFTNVPYELDKVYSISPNGTYYEDYIDSVDVTENKTLDITLSPNKYDFYIVAEDTSGSPIQGCMVKIEQEAHNTDIEGSAHFKLPQGTYNYEVTNSGYTSSSGSITIDDSQQSYSDTLVLTINNYDVTFELYENDGTTSVEGTVAFNGETKNTPGGTCTFADVLYDGISTYTATANEHENKSSQFHLTRDTTLSILLDSTQYEVVYSLTDENNNPLSGASVVIDGDEKITNELGEVSYQLYKDNYNYTIDKDYYVTLDSAILVHKDTTLQISLTPIFYDISFTVLADSSSSPIKGATISINGTDITTDNQGKASTVLKNGKYEYLVTANGYVDQSDNIAVTSDINKTLSMVAVHYTLTFHVEDIEEDTAIEGAEVSLDGESLTTNSKGEVSKMLVVGNYGYTVSAEGYHDETGTIYLNSNTIQVVRLDPVETAIESFSESVRFYPNPVKDQLTIANDLPENIYYKLLQITGKRVQEGILQQGTHTIDVSIYPPGIYFLQIKNDNQYVNYKLIIR